MASGKVHFAGSMFVNVSVGVVLVADVIGVGVGAEPAFAIQAGTFAATVITPDFDLVGTTYTEKLMNKIPVFGDLVQTSWYPYAKRSKHRGVSHAFVIGSLLRIAYCILIIMFWSVFVTGMAEVLGSTLYIDPLLPLRAIVVYWPLFFAFCLGWVVQDTMHLFLDWGSSKPKKRKKR